jgi:hypothetical protein
MNGEHGDSDLTRRTVLRKGATAAGAAVAGGAAVSGTAAAAEKRGGRAQINDDEGGDDVRRDEPFTVEMMGTVPWDASCKSEQSAMQTYVAYEVTYCDMEMNMDDDQVMIYVLPDEAQLADTEVYEIHSITSCPANDLARISFGPSNESCMT